MNKTTFGVLTSLFLNMSVGHASPPSHESVAPTATPAPYDTGTLHILKTHEVDSLDPARSFDPSSWELIGAIYEGLYQYRYLDEDYHLDPLLAADLPEATARFTRWKIRLRDDLKFQDSSVFVATKGEGRAVTTDDLIFSWKRLALPEVDSKVWGYIKGSVKGFDNFRARLAKAKGKERAAIFAEKIEGLTALDPYTLVIELTEPRPSFAHLLTLPFFSVVPREAVDLLSNRQGLLEDAAVGTGPFVLAKRTRGKTWILERNPKYRPVFYPTAGGERFRQKGLLASAGKPLPLATKILVEFEPSLEKQKEKLSSGKVDYWQTPSPSPSSTVAPTSSTGATVEMIVFNQKRGVFARNREMRLAFLKAIDREKLLAALDTSKENLADQLVPPGVSGRSPVSFAWGGPEPIPFRKLLEKAGVSAERPLPPVFLEVLDDGELSRKKADFLVATWQAAGIPVRARLSPRSLYTSRLAEGRYDLALYTWKNPVPTAEQAYQILNSKAVAPAGRNLSGFENATFDGLLEELAERNPDTQADQVKALTEKLEKIIATEAPVGPLFYVEEKVVIQPWLKNFRGSEFMSSRLKFLKVER